MPKPREVVNWLRGKAGKAVPEIEATTTTAGRIVPALADGVTTLEAAPLEQKPDLYSTEGSIGMRVVADPPSACLDIVFVHGLTGNRDTTWTHKNGVFWPEQLAKDIETARIMTFGYDADVVKLWGMAGGNNLRNHGKNLAFAVSDRRRDCRERPIIFIAHSLGGLVSEQALLICREGNKILEKVFQSTRGIIFMGTPHAGADLANWGYILAKYLNVIRKTNSAILDPLRQKSGVLTAVQQQFQQLLRKPGVSIEIYCFFEEKAVFSVGVIVPEHSAALSQYPNQSIAANHMDMTKFSGRNDEGYQKVLGRVHDNIELINSSAPTETGQEPLVNNSQNLNRLGNCEPPPSSAAGHEVIANQIVSNTGSGPAVGIGRDLHGGIHNHYAVQEPNKSKCLPLLRTSAYERHKERNPNPVPGTCQWFLHHPSYINWRNSHTSSILWVSALPGCGKSVLSKFLVDKELQATESRTTCYFFFKDDDEEQKTATNALCAILHQLFSQKPELLMHAIKIFDSNGENFTKNIDLLWNILATASADPQAGEIICILDALDEGRLSELRILIQKLCSFYDDCPRPSDKMTLKFLVTSRPLQNIADEFNDLTQKLPTIHLAGEEDTDRIRREIDLVIEDELKKIKQKWHLDENNISPLRKELAKVEHRTYLWLKLIFDLIHKDQLSVTRKGRQEIFSKVPDSVDAAYTAILNQSKDKAQAKKLLQIVCAAIRPLSVKEMSIALSIQSDDKTLEDLEIQPEDFSKNMIRNLCGLFVSVIDGRVYLLHQTAKEFLIAQDNSIQSISHPASDGIWKNSLSMQDSNVLLAYICIWFLRLEEPHRKILSLKLHKITSLTSQHDFFEYSAVNWAVHFRAAAIPEGHSLIPLGAQLCDVQADGYMSWLLVYWERTTYGTPPLGLNKLHLASYLGLKEIIGQLLADPCIDINATTQGGWTPLIWAARNGHEAVVQLLLEKGAKLETKDDNGQTPLLWAIRNGHEAVVQLLLEKGAELETKDKEYGRTPLLWAAWNGCEAVVQLLLEKGAKLETKDKEYGQTPLLLAAKNGHEAVVQLLLEKGAELKTKDKKGRTPLSWAAGNRYKAVVQLLLEKGAKIETKDKVYSQTPLSWAARNGYKAVVQLLHEKGAELETKDKVYGQTPLSWAAGYGHEAVVQLLLEKGAELKAKDDDGQTPLSWAARYGHEAVVQLLLEKGAELETKDKKGRTPLSWAAENGYKVVVQLLLQKGAELETKDKEYGQTPLSWAAENRHEAVVQLLLKKGAKKF